MEVFCTAEICGRNTAGEGASEISVQSEYVVDVERVGGNHQLVLWMAAASLQPFNIFITGYIRILAVDPLSGPVGGPIRRTLEELCSTKRIRQHKAERAFICSLPQFENSVLRGLQFLIVVC